MGACGRGLANTYDRWANSGREPNLTKRIKIQVRRPSSTDLAAFARLWHDCWHEAHSSHVPIEHSKNRTPKTFRIRLENAEDNARVVGSADDPLGLCIINKDELDAIFVSPKARGTEVASLLLADGEARLKASGIQLAFLICIAKNRRAMRFYEKSGWSEMGTLSEPVETSSGPINIECRAFHKLL